MNIIQSVLSYYVFIEGDWSASWGWGVPLIVLTVVIHVLGLGLIHQKAVDVVKNSTGRHHPTAVFAGLMGATTLLATCLHALEVGIWAFSFELLGALPSFKVGMLYSLNAMTSYGHEGLYLENHWQLMGAIEALNGWLLFGLTTAFLFGILQRVWSMSGSEGTRN